MARKNGLFLNYVKSAAKFLFNHLCTAYAFIAPVWLHRAQVRFENKESPTHASWTLSEENGDRNCVLHRGPRVDRN